MTALAQVHSTQQLEEVTLIEKREKDFVVKTKRGYTALQYTTYLPVGFMLMTFTE